jgi:hypothetical protein
MDDNNRVKLSLFLLIIPVILMTVGCSGIVKTVVYQPECPNNRWKPEQIVYEEKYKVTVYSFHQEKVSITLHDVEPDRDYRLGPMHIESLGPPLFPFIPVPWQWPKFYRFVLDVQLETHNSPAKIDFHKASIRLSEEGRIYPIAVYEVADVKAENFYCLEFSLGKACSYGKPVEEGAISISKSKAMYVLDFGKFPTNVNAVTVDLGTIYINDEEVKLPPLTYRKMTKIHYTPFFLGV